MARLRQHLEDQVTAESAAPWLRLARRTRRRINLGWWLQASGTPLVACSLVMAGLALWGRRFWPEEALRWYPWAAAGVVAVVLLASWRAVRARRVGLAGALVRLESHLRLHNALTAAAAGVTAWPPAPDQARDGVRWHLPNTLVPLLAAAAFLVAGWLVPVQARPRPLPPDEPAAWAALEQDLRDLARAEVADKESLDKEAQSVNELRAADQEKWFSHSSLEATDKLQEAHVRSMGELEKNLRQAGESLSRLTASPALPAPARAGLQDQFKQATQAMQAGGLKPNKELMDKLKALDPQQLGQLDLKQAEDLLKDMKAKSEALKECLGRQPGPGHQDPEDPNGQGQNGQGNNGKDGKDGKDGPGKGGVDRGPGTSPDLFGETQTDLQPEKPKPLDPGDLARSAPGDLLETKDSEHDVDLTSPALRSGGKATGAGGGGSAWQESLHPREQEALKNYFK